jgi:hypothetical protein
VHLFVDGGNTQLSISAKMSGKILVKCQLIYIVYIGHICVKMILKIRYAKYVGISHCLEL